MCILRVDQPLHSIGIEERKSWWLKRLKIVGDWGLSTAVISVDTIGPSTQESVLVFIHAFMVDIDYFK